METKHTISKLIIALPDDYKVLMISAILDGLTTDRALSAVLRVMSMLDPGEFDKYKEKIG